MTAPAVLWTAEEVARATRGTALGAPDWQARGVSIDTRTLHPGDLFIAIVGDRLDGHVFVAQALAGGAAAAIVSRRPDGLADDARLVQVADTLEGLRALAQAARKRTRARFIGVTGSVGKTSVKDALALVLAEQGATVATTGNLNNHWGLPLSLARVPAETGFAVLEMGMNHAGEIAPLTRLCKPHVAVITTVEAVHLENFADESGIADAKAEIFAGVVEGGAAVLFRDNRHYGLLRNTAERQGILRVVDFGEAEGVTVRLLAADADGAGCRVKAEVDGRPMSYRLAVPGRHWVINSLCVLAAVLAAGADVERAASALAGVAPGKGRGRRTAVQMASGPMTLIDDSYNASPPSMAAAFAVLGTADTGPGGRRIAVLGDMLELGPNARDMHAGLVEPLVANGIDLVFTAGPLMTALDDALPAAMRGGHAASSADLAPMVVDAVRTGDVVTVKGSAGSRMGLVVEALLGLGQQNAAGTAGRG